MLLCFMPNVVHSYCLPTPLFLQAPPVSQLQKYSSVLSTCSTWSTHPRSFPGGEHSFPACSTPSSSTASVLLQIDFPQHLHGKSMWATTRAEQDQAAARLWEMGVPHQRHGLWVLKAKWCLITAQWYYTCLQSTTWNCPLSSLGRVLGTKDDWVLQFLLPVAEWKGKDAWSRCSWMTVEPSW